MRASVDWAGHRTVDILVKLILGVAFCVVAWRPPVRDPSVRRTWWNPERKRLQARPWSSGPRSERIIRVMMFAFGCGMLVLTALKIAE